MNKYEKALDWLRDGNDSCGTEWDVLQELADKETPMKPKTVMLFGEEVPTCPTKKCGVGLNPNENIWHKSTYCGNCGQKIDWSEKDE